MATLAVAGLYGVCRAFLQGVWQIEKFASDISYGVSIFPMALLALTVVSSTAISWLMSGNKIVISLSGFISLIVILKRTFDKPGKPDALD